MFQELEELFKFGLFGKGPKLPSFMFHLGHLFLAKVSLGLFTFSFGNLSLECTTSTSVFAGMFATGTHQPQPKTFRKVRTP